MVAIRNILILITAASALTINKRDTNTILSDISNIDSNVKTLTNAVNNYSGGVFTAIPVTNAESALEKSIKQGTSDAQATSQLSSSDSNTIIAAVQNLIPDIEAALTAVKNKKSQFTSAGLKSTVQNDLASLKSETDDFANALIAVASADTKDQANAEAAKIDADFADAISYYA